MKKRRQLLFGFILTSVFLSFGILNVYSASNISDVVVSMQIGDPIMELNGAEIEIDPGRGTAPTVINNRTLVPVRAIIEAFDGTVGWDDSTQTATLSIFNDQMALSVGSNTAYLNNTPYTLDVAPAVINDRTMLPIRFIAEGFNLGVAWNNETQTVTVIRNSFDIDEYNYITSVVPEYSGSPYVEINNDTPLFKDYEIIDASFEFYGSLDNLGRCDVCMASVGSDLMPDGDRESLSSVTPSGWLNKTYDFVPGSYLYNRCHLIGYQLTGENANERNLITGTRYLNIEGMLPFENMIDDYIDSTDNNVMYRVTPVFKNDNLVADGVLLEAYSIEDNGAGISFCVYCYNLQPYVTIDYLTGDSYSDGTYTEPSYDYEESYDSYTDDNNTYDNTSDTEVYAVYRTPTGKRYHFSSSCGGKNSYETTLSAAQGAGLTPCQKCAK